MFCKLNYFLVTDKDECVKNSPPPCSHNCTNIPFGFECSCAEGYVLGADGKTCAGKYRTTGKYRSTGQIKLQINTELQVKIELQVNTEPRLNTNPQVNLELHCQEIQDFDF